MQCVELVRSAAEVLCTPTALSQLLQHGANINHINNKLEGGTALHEAVANQQVPVASLLVQRGCMPTLENIKGTSSVAVQALIVHMHSTSTTFSPGLTPLDLAIKGSNAQMLRLLEQQAWFRGHLLVKVPTLGGMKKQWARRWAVVVPRYPCPSLPNERRRGYHVMLLLYKRDDHSTPCARIFLNGASATPALPKEARGAQRPSAMYPLQCIVVRHYGVDSSVHPCQLITWVAMIAYHHRSVIALSSLYSLRRCTCPMRPRLWPSRPMGALACWCTCDQRRPAWRTVRSSGSSWTLSTPPLGLNLAPVH